MEDDDARRDLSLIPYSPQSQVVLRHGSSVVVYDDDSKQLVASSPSQAVELANCPYCHRPLNEPTEDESHDAPLSPGGFDSNFVSPSYFRMLQRSRAGSQQSSRPASPRWHLVGSETHQSHVRTPSKQSAAAHTPPPTSNRRSSTQGISSAAFSPNYFKTFFVEERELGRGGKGVVFLVRHVLDGVDLGKYACKRVPVGDDHAWLERALLEVSLLQNLSHQHLVSYKHVWLEEAQLSKFGPSVPCAYILQHYCNAGDLHHYVLGPLASAKAPTPEQLKERVRSRSKGQQDHMPNVSTRRMHFDEILSFFKDITSGLHHLHANGYIHRDLKPSNCLLHKTGPKIKVLLSDFGEMQGANVVRTGSGATGSIAYSAPEVIRREGPDGTFGNFSQKSDVFSLGLVLYFMCFGRLPYASADEINEDNEDVDELREEISTWAGIDEDRKERNDLPERLYKFLKLLLSFDPEKRPSTEDIVHGLKANSMPNEQGHFSSFGRAQSPREFDEPGARLSQVEGSSKKEQSFDKSSPGAHGWSSQPMSRASSGDSRRPSAVRRQQSEEVIENRGMAAKSSGALVRAKRSQTASPVKPLETPRLMPPPVRTRRSKMGSLLKRREAVASSKLILFCFKVWSLSRPCNPLAASAAILYPTLSLAALDLIGLSEDYKLSVGLLILHIVTLATAQRLQVLCSRHTDFPKPELG